MIGGKYMGVECDLQYKHNTIFMKKPFTASVTLFYHYVI